MFSWLVRWNYIVLSSPTLKPLVQDGICPALVNVFWNRGLPIQNHSVVGSSVKSFSAYWSHLFTLIWVQIGNEGLWFCFISGSSFGGAGLILSGWGCVQVDPSMLQHQNQRLAQQLDVQRSEISALEDKFSTLKGKQASYDDNLMTVNRRWNQVNSHQILILSLFIFEKSKAAMRTFLSVTCLCNNLRYTAQQLSGRKWTHLNKWRLQEAAWAVVMNKVGDKGVWEDHWLLFIKSFLFVKWLHVWISTK